MRQQRIKEPIKYPWVWVGLIVIILLGVPWYLPAGGIQPIILGFPYWAFISLVMAVVLSAYLSWMLHSFWKMDETEEE